MSIANKSAAVTREEWDWYQNNIVPQMRNQLGRVADPSEGVAQAQSDATKSYDISRNRTNLNLSRYGIGMTGDQQKAYNRNMALGMGGAVANAGNQQRLGNVDRRVSQLGNLMATTQGLSTSAQKGLGQATALESGREANNQALAAQKKQSRNNMIGTIGGALLSFI